MLGRGRGIFCAISSIIDCRGTGLKDGIVGNRTILLYQMTWYDIENERMREWQRDWCEIRYLQQARVFSKFIIIITCFVLCCVCLLLFVCCMYIKIARVPNCRIVHCQQCRVGLCGHILTYMFILHCSLCDVLPIYDHWYDNISSSLSPSPPSPLFCGLVWQQYQPIINKMSIIFKHCCFFFI